MYLKYFLIATLVFIGLSCSQYDKLLKEGDPETKYAKAVEYYQSADYFKALQLFDNLMTAFRGTNKAEQVYYYYAWCNFFQGDYELAAFHFRTFVRTFPNSKHAEECAFQVAYCKYLASPDYFLDQTATNEALEQFQLFINKYPKSEKIAECNKLMDELRTKLELKSFYTAKVYYDTEEYKASIVTFSIFIKDFPASKKREEATYYLLRSQYIYALNSIPAKQKERFEDMMKTYQNFTSRYPESKYAKNAKDMAEESKNYLK